MSSDIIIGCDINNQQQQLSQILVIIKCRMGICQTKQYDANEARQRNPQQKKSIRKEFDYPSANGYSIFIQKALSLSETFFRQVKANNDILEKQQTIKMSGQEMVRQIEVNYAQTIKEYFQIDEVKQNSKRYTQQQKGSKKIQNMLIQPYRVAIFYIKLFKETIDDLQSIIKPAQAKEMNLYKVTSNQKLYSKLIHQLQSTRQEQQQYNRMKQQNDTMKQQLDRMKQTILDLNEQKDRLEQRLREANQLIEQNNIKINQLTSTLKIPNQINQKLNSQQNTVLTLEEKMQESIKQQQKDVLPLEENIQELTEQKQKDVLPLEEKIQALMKQQQKYKDQIQQLERQFSIKKQDFQQASSELKRQIGQLKQLVVQKDQQLNKITQQKKELSQQLTQNNQLLEENTSMLENYRKEMKQLEEINKRLISREQSTGIRRSFFIQNSMFVGSILEERHIEKMFLKETIQDHMQRQIIKTEKIYDFKRGQKVDFHNFLDNKEGIVAVIETATNHLIACYYSGVYKKTTMNQEGLIISLTNSKSYCLNNFRNNPKKNQKEKKNITGMTYDQFFIIFGNSEVRLKQGEIKLYSNFGLSNSYFMSQGDKVDALLGEGSNNEVDILNYEIYQIFLQQRQKRQE